MAAVDQARDGFLGGDLDQQDGDEALQRVMAGDVLAVVDHAGFHTACQVGQIGGVPYVHPEGAEHHRGGLDGRKSLAAHVTDDQSHPVRGLPRLVEVAADAGLGAAAW